MSFLTNAIFTHLLAAFLGAGGAWYATHKTAVKAAAASVVAAADALKKS